MTVRNQFKIGMAALLRGLDFVRGGRAALSWMAVILFFAGGAMAGPTNALSDAEVQGRQLAQQLVEQWPATNFTQTGVLKIRDGKRNRSEVPVKCEIIVTTTNWLSVYDATCGGTNRVILKIVHQGEAPNIYQLADVKNADGAVEKATVLSGEQAMVSFAGSDFWMADLGLEFFHWPVQKLLKREFKRGCGCRVLESTNPHPSPNSYSRVVSWIDNETGGIVQAEGYDVRGKKLKEFAPKSFKKVSGQWELQEMEILNVQTHSSTQLKFDLQKE
jgi:hypothetical protein